MRFTSAISREDSKAEQPGDSKAEQPETAAASTAEPEAADQGISPYPAEAAAQKQQQTLMQLSPGDRTGRRCSYYPGDRIGRRCSYYPGDRIGHRCSLDPRGTTGSDTDFVPEDTFSGYAALIRQRTGRRLESSPERASEPQVAGDSYIEQIYLNYVAKNDETESSPEDGGEIAGANLREQAEKSVDSSEIIDKMGIENKVT